MDRNGWHYRTSTGGVSFVRILMAREDVGGYLGCSFHLSHRHYRRTSLSRYAIGEHEVLTCLQHRDIKCKGGGPLRLSFYVFYYIQAE